MTCTLHQVEACRDELNNITAAAREAQNIRQEQKDDAARQKRCISISLRHTSCTASSLKDQHKKAGTHSASCVS
jgi:hypothetical protein